jgi:murein L,D-transpeptidase YcbB/YkuD
MGLRVFLGPRAIVRVVLLASWLSDAQAQTNALQDALANSGSLAAAGLTLADAATLDRFHATRGYAPLFVDEGGATVRGKSLAHAFDAASAEGLEPSDYDLTSLQGLATSDDPADRATAELTAAALALHYARDLAGGRLEPRVVSSIAAVKPPGIDVARLFEALAASDDVPGAIESQLPARPRIAALREALARLRFDETHLPPWSNVAPGATLHSGDQEPRVRALQSALIDRGDFVAGDPAVANSETEHSASSLRYDPLLVDATRRFQARHGLAPDGVVGAETLAALEVSRARRIEQLVMNLERERWFDAEPGLHIDVNVPAFELEAFEGSELRLRTRVIVGTRKNPTPILADRIRWIELNPRWNVPRSIALAEYANDLRTNPARLAARGYELVPPDGGDAIDPTQVDWAALGGRFPFRLRQRTGSNNALGRLKFVFPNPLSVYLHDTPSRGLFARSTRAFSHGCVRVENPVALAALLLDHDGEWSEARLDTEIDGGRRQRLTLPNPVSIRLVYRTAFVDAAGTLQLRADLYGRDARQLTTWSMARRGTLPATPREGRTPDVGP